MGKLTLVPHESITTQSPVPTLTAKTMSEKDIMAAWISQALGELMRRRIMAPRGKRIAQVCLARGWGLVFANVRAGGRREWVGLPGSLGFRVLRGCGSPLGRGVVRPWFVVLN